MKSIINTSKLAIVVLTFLALTATVYAAAATPAQLPPAAQEAVNKGIIAAKIPDYLLAIRYFEEARKIAPQAPVIYLNMGLAESKIPGRELRAIGWFGAYLAAYPDAPNAAAVKEQIVMLEVRNQSNVLRLIRSVQDAVVQLSGYDRTAGLQRVSELWTNIGDITTALSAADLIEDGRYKSEQKTEIQTAIAEIQIKNGDTVGAKKTLATALRTADLIQGAAQKSSLQSAIAKLQIEADDITNALVTLATALKNADLVARDYGDDKKTGYLETARSRLAIAKVQIKAGDHVGAHRTLAAAQKTVSLIDTSDTSASLAAFTLRDIAEAQANSGDIAGALISLNSAQETAGRIQNPLEKKQAQYFHTSAQRAIAEAQIKAGDFAGALKSIKPIDDKNFKDKAYSAIAPAQAKAGDFAGAQKTASLVSIEYFRSVVLREVAAIKAKAGTISMPNPSGASTPDTNRPIQPVTKVSDWLKILDDGDKINDCPLNTGPFLDLGGYLKSMPPSDNPKKVFESLHETARKIVKAQNIITRMLEQGGKK